MRLSAIFAILVVSFAVAPASSLNAQGGVYEDLDICVVRLIKDIDVPARETGLLKELLVEQNDAVKMDAVVAKIDDKIAQRMREQAQLKHSVASREFEDDTQIKAAERKMKLTEEEYKTTYALYDKGSKTHFEAMRALYQKQIAKLEYDAAINAQQLAGIQANAEMVNVAAAEDSIVRHVINSPIDGYVLNVYREAGEWVNAGEKIIRVAPLNKLRVQGNMNAQKYDAREVDGKPVTVTLTRAHEKQVQFFGTVVLTSIEKQGGSSYQVIAEVENRFDESQTHFLLQPGSDVVMRIHIDGVAPKRLANNEN